MIKGGKTCFRWNASMIDYISTYKSQMAFMELDLKLISQEWMLNWE